MAAELVVSPKTVQTHVTNIYHRYDIHNRHELMAFALLRGLMPTSDIMFEALRWRLGVERDRSKQPGVGVGVGAGVAQPDFGPTGFGGR